jgi:glucose-6-phosphate dehydrogenase assembly protein OpcA
VSEDVWSERDTTPDAIESALRQLLRERHAADRALAPARVLNLIVVVDREWKGEISNRLERVGRYHASRTILCAVEAGRETLDAVATMVYEESSADGIHPMRERVEIDIGPEHLSRLDTIVDPVLVSELPKLLWSPHGHEEAVQAVLPLMDVILLDSDDDHDGDHGLARGAELLKSAYVVDLAWLRTTPWRERLAASFDPPERLAALERLTEVCVRHRPGSGASAALLAGWLASRLRWQAAPLQSSNGAGRRGTALRTGSGEPDEIEVALATVDQAAPGLAGVTVAWDDCSLSLDRGKGGLQVRHQTPAGGERSWRVLGASRGEGGILGEGVRQALLRDPTYGPALGAAMTLCGEASS